MTDKKLKTFKISDTQRPMVSRSGMPQEQQQPESFSLGYEKIELLLETEDPNEVVSGMNRSLGSLQQVFENTRIQREKDAAIKSIRAYELTLDLLEFLFQTRTTLSLATSCPNGKKKITMLCDSWVRRRDRRKQRLVGAA